MNQLVATQSRSTSVTIVECLSVKTHRLMVVVFDEAGAEKKIQWSMEAYILGYPKSNINQKQEYTVSNNQVILCLASCIGLYIHHINLCMHIFS